MPRGVHFLDAPVSGGVRGARKGTLAIMVGGDKAVYDSCEPVLQCMGSNVFHVGDIGAGNVAKLVNNMLAFIHMMGCRRSPRPGSQGRSRSECAVENRQSQQRE